MGSQCDGHIAENGELGWRAVLIDIVTRHIVYSLCMQVLFKTFADMARQYRLDLGFKSTN